MFSMTTIQTNNMMIVDILNGDIVLCKNFMKQVIKPYVPDNLRIYGDIGLDENVKYIVKEVNEISRHFHCAFYYNLGYNNIKILLQKMLKIISKFYEDGSGIQHNIDLLTEEVLLPNKSRKYEAMYRLIDIRLFVYLLHYLKIDEREIFTEREELKTFLYNAVTTYQHNDKNFKGKYYTNYYIGIMNDETIETLISGLFLNVDILIEEYNKKRPSLYTVLQHYFEDKKFTYDSSHLKDTFIKLRLL